MKKTFIGAVSVFAGLGLLFIPDSTAISIGFFSMILGAFILVKEYFSKD